MVERALLAADMACQPVTTLDLDEAARVIAEAACDIALVDVFMYDRASGFEVVRRLRSEGSTVSLPILITSGAAKEVARRVEFLQEHACEVLLKPFEPDQLIERVRSMLRTPCAGDLASISPMAESAPGDVALRLHQREGWLLR
jgi:DNA-binding response OmpR family regulator